MRGLRTILTTFLFATILMISSLGVIAPVTVRAADTELVPAPFIMEKHEFNKSETYEGTIRENYDNEVWSVGIMQGNVITLLLARNYTDTSNGQTFVDYNQNINFYIGEKFYISMFMIDRIMFKIGGQNLTSPLKTCSDFDLAYTSIVYDGAIPTMECNITFEGVRVYPDFPGSTFDLTLHHIIRTDWYETRIKVEAFFDFAHTRFFNGSDYAQGEPFTAEIRYVMQLTDPELVGDNTIRPTERTDSAMIYNMTLNNSAPYALSRLEMRDDFTVHDAAGDHSLTGYSFMRMGDEMEVMPDGHGQYNPGSAVVTHGFPNLTYLVTQTLLSDPEVVVFHDRATAYANPMLIVLIVAIASVSAIGPAIAVIVWKRRKGKKGTGKEQKESA